MTYPHHPAACVADICFNTRTRVQGVLLVVAALWLTAGCSVEDGQSVADVTAEHADILDRPEVERPLPFEPESESDSLVFAPFQERWTGDLDVMVKRRTIRALVVYSRTHFFFDGVAQRGMAHEAMQSFEQFINRRFNKKTLKIDVLYIPVSTEQLIPALIEGVGDIALANLTVTPARSALVDFSEPTLTDVKEIVVTGPAVPEPASIGDLAGQKVYVRPSSSYFDSLHQLNERLLNKGLEPASLVSVNRYLEDEDLLEMVNAGILPRIVVDSHIASVWRQALDGIVVHEDVVVNSGGSIAWAMRKGSPKLKAAVNEFIREHRKGTLFGNIVFQRYLQNANYVRNPLSVQDEPKLREALALLQQYAAQYGFDWTLIAAQAYQESRIDQAMRSRAGAVGVMQVLPSTARDKNVGIANIHSLENNIHAGIKYLRFISDRYFSDEDMDEFNRTLFAIASYNVGPARMARLRKEAGESGLDPNIWFDHVEIIAARRVGQEPVRYVRNILKYWLTYNLLEERDLLVHWSNEGGES